MSPLGRIVMMARPFRGRFTLAVLLGVLSAFSSVGLMASAGWLISRSARHPPIFELGLAIVAVRAFALTRAGGRYFERLTSHDATLRFLTRVRVSLFDRLVPLSPGGLERSRGGDLITRLVADADAFGDLFIRGIGPIIVAAATIALTVVVASMILPVAGLTIGVALVGAAVGVPIVAARAGRSSGRDLGVARTELATGVVDLIEGAPELVANGATLAHFGQAMASDARVERAERGRARTVGVAGTLGTLLMLASIWLVLFEATPAVGVHRIEGESLAVLVLLILASFEVVITLGAALARLEETRRSASRVFEVVDAEPPVSDPPTARTMPSTPFTLRMRNGDLRYAPDALPSLENVDLDLTPGKRVVVIGASGSGKTTLAEVLVRFRELDSGRVTLDGHDLKEYAQDDVRRAIGLVGGDSYVFDQSLRDNLRLGKPDVSDDELDDVAARVRLLSWIRSLPDGWGTRAGEAGERLSGGQRQRLVLARALLADPRVLILDEPTAHLDDQTADAMLSDLLEASGKRTLLLITHRLVGIDDFDEVIVLEAGSVIRRGAPVDVLTS